MKTLVSALCLFLSTSAFAAIDFSTAQVIDKVEANGKPSKYSGTVQIINDNVNGPSRIVLQIAAPFYCPAGRVCAQVMDAHTISAEIVSQTEQCGSIIYNAITDGTPYDGLKEEITLQDNSARMCRDMRKGLIEIDAKTTAVRTQSVRTYFAVQTYKYDSENFDLSKGVKFSKVKLEGGEAAGRGGFVQVNARKKEVVISYSFVSCSQGACQAMYQTKQLKLKLVSKLKDICGTVIYKANTKNILMGGEYQQFTIEDNTNRICENVIRARLTINGTISHPYPQSTPVTIEMLK